MFDRWLHPISKLMTSCRNVSLWSTSPSTKSARWLARPKLLSRRQLWSTRVLVPATLPTSIPRSLSRIRLCRTRAGELLGRSSTAAS